MNRCYNDLFLYCPGQPKTITRKEDQTYRDLGGHLQTVTIPIIRCTQNPKTNHCSQTLSEQIEILKTQHPSQVPKKLQPVQPKAKKRTPK